ncbi:MAG: EamA family transporter [Gammaproteobacteria bacterium]|nr:EamA family transporter [Gammaproteobacteria bacterium]
MKLKHGTLSFYAIGFLLLMVFDTIAQLCFKYTAINALPLQANVDWLLRILSHPWIYGAVFGYIGAFLTWMTLLKKAPIGPAFAASHLDVISVMLCSYWLLNEHLSWIQLVGAVVILVGIMCLAFGEKAEEQS